MHFFLLLQSKRLRCGGSRVVPFPTQLENINRVMESPGELVELSAFTVSARRQTGTFLPPNPQSSREFRRLPSRTVLTPIFAKGTSNCVETDALFCFDNSEKQRNIFKDTKGRSRNKFLSKLNSFLKYGRGFTSNIDV